MKEDVPVVFLLSFNESKLWYKVFDRRTKRIVEEVIDGKIVLSMRALYQSKVGLTLINTGKLEPYSLSSSYFPLIII
jgi:hypothetical protein